MEDDATVAWRVVGVEIRDCFRDCFNMFVENSDVIIGVKEVIVGSVISNNMACHEIDPILIDFMYKLIS